MTPEQLDAELAIFSKHCKRHDIISNELAADLWPAWHARAEQAHAERREMQETEQRLRAEISRLQAVASRAVPDGWKLVPVEPTKAMWAAVNKLDNEMAAGAYDGRGCTIEQAWHCLVDASPQPQDGTP